MYVGQQNGLVNNFKPLQYIASNLNHFKYAVVIVQNFQGVSTSWDSTRSFLTSEFTTITPAL
jgi:hypothetical protein